MADPSDYAQMWGSVYTPVPTGDESGGVYLLDDEKSVGRERGAGIYDDCTRILYDDAHPRTHPGGQRYPGPYGAGRASDRIGPGLDERRDDLYRAEGFAAAPRYEAASPAERAAYIRGDRRLGHPGPRGMVTSSREGRPAVDDSVWDARPPHYAPGSGNEFAHLYVDPAAQGPVLHQRDLTYPGFEQIDRFAGGAGGGVRVPLQVVQTIIILVVVILLAMWLAIGRAVSQAEKRLERDIMMALREAART